MRNLFRDFHSLIWFFSSLRQTELDANYVKTFARHFPRPRLSLPQKIDGKRHKRKQLIGVKLSNLCVFNVQSNRTLIHDIIFPFPMDRISSRHKKKFPFVSLIEINSWNHIKLAISLFIFPRLFLLSFPKHETFLHSSIAKWNIEQSVTEPQRLERRLGKLRPRSEETYRAILDENMK